MIPLRTYVESVYTATRHGFTSAFSASIAAVSSMRLFVVASSPPQSSFSRLPERSTTPQPPGPGFRGTPRR